MRPAAGPQRPPRRCSAGWSAAPRRGETALCGSRSRFASSKSLMPLERRSNAPRRAEPRRTARHALNRSARFHSSISGDSRRASAERGLAGGGWGGGSRRGHRPRHRLCIPLMPQASAGAASRNCRYRINTTARAAKTNRLTARKGWIEARSKEVSRRQPWAEMKQAAQAGISAGQDARRRRWNRTGRGAGRPSGPARVLGSAFRPCSRRRSGGSASRRRGSRGRRGRPCAR